MKYLFALLLIGCTYQPPIEEPVLCKEFEPYRRNKCMTDCHLGDTRACYKLCKELYPYSCK